MKGIDIEVEIYLDSKYEVDVIGYRAIWIMDMENSEDLLTIKSDITSKEIAEALAEEHYGIYVPIFGIVKGGE